MHTEAACGLRDVKVGFSQRLVDAFPLQGFDGGRTPRHFYIGVAFGIVESRNGRGKS